MPPDTVVIDRSSPFGNPFVIGSTLDHPLSHLGRVDVRDAQHATVLFQTWLETTPAGLALTARIKRDLTGKNVACWCHPDAYCHGDVILRVAAKR